MDKEFEFDSGPVLGLMWTLFALALLLAA